MAANITVTLHDLKLGNKSVVSHTEVIRLANDDATNKVSLNSTAVAMSAATQLKISAPLLSVIVEDFLKRYNSTNKAMLGKLTGTLAILIELVGDKPINQILQADLNNFFDEVQKLPVRRDSKKFADMGIKEIIIANAGEPCIAEKMLPCLCQCLYSMGKHPL